MDHPSELVEAEEIPRSGQCRAALHRSRFRGDDHATLLVVSGYNISLASLLLLSGRLADRLGRRRVFTFGLWGFLAGSALEQQFVVVFLPASVLLGFGAGATIAGLQSAAATRQAQVNT